MAVYREVANHVSLFERKKIKENDCLHFSGLLFREIRFSYEMYWIMKLKHWSNADESKKQTDCLFVTDSVKM